MAEMKVATNNLKVKFDGLPKPAKMKKPRLPAHAKKMAKRGLISEKQMSKMKGGAI